MITYLPSSLISAERLPQVARPAGGTHVLFQQQVDPLCGALGSTAGVKMINKGHLMFSYLQLSD